MYREKFFGRPGGKNGYVIAVVAVFLLSACAVGLDFKSPAKPVAKGYAPQEMPVRTVSSEGMAGKSQSFSTLKEVSFDWWTVFQSPQLNAMIERAFKNNPNIESAQAALRQARQYVAAQQGFFYPSVSAGYTPSRNKLAGNMGGNSPGMQEDGSVIQTYSNPNGPQFNGPAYYNFHTAQLTVGYVPDLFGSNKRQVEALQAQEEEQAYLLEATYITLASNVVAAALQEASLRAQLAAQTRVLDLSRENLTILENQYRLGAVSRLDVLAQENALAQAEQALIPLQAQLEKKPSSFARAGRQLA